MCFYFLISIKGGFSYSLSDHRLLTQLAIAQFEKCVDQKITADRALEMYRGNFEEDMNLYRKWFSYSHYYHPEKKIDMWRWSSQDRILNLEEYLFSSFKNTTDEAHQYFVLGGALHHLQDMASPPHVVPVTHDLRDGFEDYEISLKDLNESFKSDPCHFIKDSADIDSLSKIHQSMAEETLKSARSVVPGSVNLVPMLIAWEAFWAESSERAFGSYGYLGNVFGKTKILYHEFTYEIKEEDYKKFKTDLMK